jgi:hypothetical protein
MALAPIRIKRIKIEQYQSAAVIRINSFDFTEAKRRHVYPGNRRTIFNFSPGKDIFKYRLKNSLKAFFHYGRRVIWFLHPPSYQDIERIVLK